MPGCLSTPITTTIPLTVTVKNEGGVPQEGLRVYAFNGGSYTGYNKTTDMDGETIFTLPQGDYRFRADSEGVQYWSGESNHCTIPSCLSAAVTVPGGIVAETTVITYTYDPLYRLTAANYDNGDSFDYTYDSTGNRLIKEECLSGLECLTTAYAYDIANRLVTVQDGVLPAVSYQWDANGNLLNDGVNTYVYNHANRLSSVSGQSESSYAYNGMGDRVQQTVDGKTTTYTLDTAIGLTQVLADGENAYLYGLGRIAQLNTDPLKTEYFLGDALGSVRQLTDESGVVTLVKGYQPYGDVMSSAGGGVSSYGFTGEWTDVSGMVYLRARYYSPWQGRFINHDPWSGDYNQPISYNPWLYGYANPIMYTDPSGMIPKPQDVCDRLPPDDAYWCRRARECQDSECPGQGCTYLGDFNISAYYVASEEDYKGIGQDIPIKSDRTHDHLGPYLSGLGPFYYYDETYAMDANENFLFMGDSVCMQGSGRLSKEHGGHLISCSSLYTWSGLLPKNQRGSVGFAWTSDQTLSEYRSFETVAACECGQIAKGDKLYVNNKEFNHYLGKWGNSSGILTRTDSGGGLCKSDTRDYFTLDLYVGEGKKAREAYLDLMNSQGIKFPELVPVYLLEP